MSPHAPKVSKGVSDFIVGFQRVWSPPRTRPRSDYRIALAWFLGLGFAVNATVQAAGSPQPVSFPHWVPHVTTPSADPGNVRKPVFAAHRLIVKFKPAPDAGRSPVAGAAALGRRAIGALATIQGRSVKKLRGIGAHVVETRHDVGKAIDALYRSGAVEYAEADYQVHAIAVPNDPNFGVLWGLDNTGQSGGLAGADIDAPAAWDLRTATDKRTVIAVLDSGVDYNHPDLAPNMWKNPGEIPGNGIDDDGNGWVDDIYGADFVGNDSDPMDDYFHGTHVSGTIGASGNDGAGVTGVAWKTRIMALKFLDSTGFGWESDAIEAMDYAAKLKVVNNYHMIINNSWGGGPYSQAMFNELNYLRGLGILVTAAAGNDGLNTDASPSYPAGYNLPNIVSVGATDASDAAAWFSDRGCGSVDVYAPGVGIYSTLPGGGYGYLDGTSMAAPHVSAMLGLVWSQNPAAGWRRVKSALLNSVDPVSNLEQRAVTQGRVNLFKALQPAAINEPTVWRVSPLPSAPGTHVSISGQNFGFVPGAVAIGATPLTVLSWTDTQIRASVPFNAQMGTGTLKVSRSDGNDSDVGACADISFEPTLIGQTNLARTWASGARVGGNFWIFGGDSPTGITSLVEKVSLPRGTGRVSPAWSMPTAVWQGAAASIGNKVYVVGGYDPANQVLSDKLQIFDTGTGKWTAGAPLPLALAQIAAAASGGKLYVFGGVDSIGFSNGTTYIYDPATNAWSSGAVKPTPVNFATAIASPAGPEITLAGGYAISLGGETNVVEIYDTAADAWVSGTPLNHARSGAAGAYYKGKDHVLFGGLNSPNTGGEWWDGSAWVDAISAGPALFSAMAATDYSGNSLFILDGSDQISGSYSSNIWRIREP
ncbi:MAG: hypothetical protein FIA97_11425 [Methylococcaceae bacterium]|nr:hypothetical protein [Methylococcaceae bacterium]